MSWLKTEAREFMIDAYRGKIGYDVPPVQQYWTLGGDSTINGGKPNPDSEVAQMVYEGLVTEKQIHSIDKDGTIIEANRRAYPIVNWIVGDFSATLLQQGDDFSPSIINLDTMSFPVAATKELIPAMESVNHIKHPLMLAFNVVSYMPCYNKKKWSVDEILVAVYEKLVQNQTIDLESWTDYDGGVLQYMSEDRYTQMTTIILFKNI